MLVQPLLQWRSNKHYIWWVRVFRNPTCSARAPYCHLLPARCYNMFPHYLTKGTIFEKKKVFEQKICVLIFSTNFIWNISRPKKNWARYIKNVYWSSRKIPVILVRFWWYLNFLNRFSKNTQKSNFLKIRTVGAEELSADEQTDGRTDGRTDRHDEGNILKCFS